MYGYVYLTTNIVNNMKYIGKHKSDKFDEKYYGSGVLLQRAISKYGKYNFTIEVLGVANSLEELNELEKKYILKYECHVSEEFYNLSKGGDGGDPFAHLSSDIRKEVLSNRPNGMTGKKHSDETKAKISEALMGNGKGVPKSEEHKRKLSESNKGKNLGKPSPLKGGKLKEETKKKISIARMGQVSPTKGVKLSEETINKIKKSKKGKYVRGKHPLARKCLLIYPNGKEFVFECLNDLKDFIKDDLSSEVVKKLVKSGNPYKTNRKNKKYMEGVTIKYLDNTSPILKGGD